MPQFTSFIFSTHLRSLLVLWFGILDLRLQESISQLVLPCIHLIIEHSIDEAHFLLASELYICLAWSELCAAAAGRI